jgi:hypothetical protein
MKKFNTGRSSERGSATVKFLFVFTILFLIGHAGCNYVPVAYDGASFRQEMDTAVVKALGASGRVQPVDVVKATLQKASVDYNVPADALVEVKPVNGVVEAHVQYQRKVNMLPLGMYKYTYNFDYVAKPVGYLLK